VSVTGEEPCSRGTSRPAAEDGDVDRFARVVSGSRDRVLVVRRRRTVVLWACRVKAIAAPRFDGVCYLRACKCSTESSTSVRNTSRSTSANCLM